ncbi:MAG: tellurite methyltransferase [Lentimonas sp.]|jgi:tellurite methyltransferase
MINKEYWNNFYKLDIVPRHESPFADYVMDYIISENLKDKKLIDVACGNGRDTFFFKDKGVSSTGIDLSVNPDAEDTEFIQGNILQFDYSPFELIYLRFIVHALKEVELDLLLNRIAETTGEATLFIETRSSKGVTDEDKSETFFKSGIGEEHFRMLYSEAYLTQKMNEKFEVIKVEENNGFSVFNGNDPVCIRYILRKKL